MRDSIEIRGETYTVAIRVDEISGVSAQDGITTVYFGGQWAQVDMPMPDVIALIDAVEEDQGIEEAYRNGWVVDDGEVL